MPSPRPEFLNDCLEQAELLIEICRRFHASGWLAACDGNLSFKKSDGSVVMTPTGRAKAFLKPHELAHVSAGGETLYGAPSGERPMHLAVYRRCPQARAVVHAHPPRAIAWSVARPNDRELPANAFSELILAVGAIPIAPFARPGSDAMGTQLEPFLPHRRALILARHGALAWGESLEEAAMGIERIEHAATVLALAMSLGGVTELGEDDVAELTRMRAAGPQRIF